MLGNVEGTVGLDLCCGAGTFGLEALSRGAAEVVFVDRSPRSLKIVRANLDTVGVGEEALLVRGDVEKPLPLERLIPRRFDWLFLDPPYALVESPAGRTRIAERLRELAHAGAFEDDPWILLEHRSRIASLLSDGGLEIVETRAHGEGAVSFLRAPSGHDADGGPYTAGD